MQRLPDLLPEAFRGWNFSPSMRAHVHRMADRYAWMARIASPAQRLPRRWPGFGWAAWAAVAVTILLLVWRWLPGDAGQGAPVQVAGQPVYTALVDLDGRGEDELVAVWQIEGIRELHQVLALVWQRPNRTAPWELLYVAPLNGELVFPVQVIEAPDRPGKAVLVSSQGSSATETYSLILHIDGPVVRTLPVSRPWHWMLEVGS